MFLTLNLYSASPSTPILPSDNIQDPGSLSTPWGGCGPSDSNCYVELTSFTNETVTGLDYSTSTGLLSLTAGYEIPTIASTTAWNTAIGALDGSVLVQNGNSFGGTLTLGTNDNNGLSLETNNVDRLTIDTSGNVNITGALTLGTQLADGQFIKSGDWTGLFDGQEGSYYLDRANQTGTQLALTISDFASSTRTLLSSVATGLTYSTTTGQISLTAGYVIPTQVQLDNKQDLIATGTISQYFRGDLSLATFPTNVSEFTNDENFISDLSAFTTDDLTQGVSNLYSQWATSGSDVSYVDGNVGIGTTTPISKLSVAVTGDGDGVNIYNLQTGISAASAGLNLFNNVGGQGAFVKLYSDNNTVSSGLNNALYVKNSVGGMRWIANTGSSIGFGIGTSISNADDLVISSSGNIGIGTTNPNQKLDVNGNILLTGNNTYVYFRDEYNYIKNTDGLPVDIKGHHGVRAYNDLGEVARFGIAGDSLNSYFNGNVGIGTVTPTYKLDVEGTGAVGSFVTTTNTSDALYIQSTSATGYSSIGFLNNSSSQVGSFGYANPSALSPLADSVFFNANNKAMNFSVTGGAATHMKISTAGNVGIGTTTPADRLQVFGDVRLGTTGSNGCIKNYAGTGITGTCSSDERLKTNVIDLSDGYLEKLVNLKVITYNWNNEANTLNKVDTTVTNYGLLAQNVESIFPELVTTDSNGYKQVNYSRLPLYLLKSLQELSKKVIGFADEFRTKKLCVGDTCINEDQLKMLLQNQNIQYSSPTSTSAPAPTTSTPEPETSDSDTSTETEVSDNEETVTEEPVPEVVPEPPAPEPEPEIVVEPTPETPTEATE